MVAAVASGGYSLSRSKAERGTSSPTSNRLSKSARHSADRRALRRWKISSCARAAWEATRRSKVERAGRTTSQRRKVSSA